MIRIPDAVRALCLGLPETSEVLSHGSPDFRVRGKPFATYCVNFHGDGRVALWVRSPAGVQQLYSEINPKAYFVPPYIGVKGWLGIELNQGLDWSEIASRVLEAWKNAAPPSLGSTVDTAPHFDPPDVPMSPEEINPMLAEPNQGKFQRFAERCMSFPEVNQAMQFGNPVWKAGKKTFASAYIKEGRLQFQFRTGLVQQEFLIADPRYTIPMYLGSKGWTDLDVSGNVNWKEVDGLLDLSYRHFALKRMLRALDSVD